MEGEYEFEEPTMMSFTGVSETGSMRKHSEVVTKITFTITDVSFSFQLYNDGEKVGYDSFREVKDVPMPILHDIRENNPDLLIE